MKTAVVFYTLDGNCAIVAQEIKSILNADLIQLHTDNEKKRKGIVKFFWACGMMFKKKPKLKPYSFDPSAYDLIIIGAPVWAGAPASPIKTFIANTSITSKKIALFVCHAGGSGNSIKIFKTMLSGNEFIAEIEFKDPSKNNIEEIKQQIADWVKGFK